MTNGILNFRAAAQLLAPALLALVLCAPSRAAEFEVTDRLAVNGISVLKSSATVYGKDAASGYSLWLSSGINMANGTVNAKHFVGDGLGLTGVDFLGIDQTLSGVKTFTSSITVTAALGIGVLKTSYGANRELSPAAAAQYGGIYSSTHVYVGGNVYAVNYYGDGSALTGISGDNLGNHTATTNIKLNSNWLSNDGGNEGITVDNSGNVGVGTSDPEGYKLKVNGESYFVGSSSVTGKLTVTDGFAMYGGQLYTSYTSDGLWGATATPSYIKGASEGAFILGYQDNGSGLYGPAYGLEVKHTDGLAQNITYSAVIMRDIEDQTMPFWITNKGGAYLGAAVGIGTASPQTGAMLHVRSGASSAVMPANNQAVFEQLSGSNGGIGIAYNNSSAGFYGHNGINSYDWGLEDIGGSRKIGLRASGSDRIIIDTSGNVGISTDTPQARLDVKSAGNVHTDMAQIWRDSDGVKVGSMSATGVMEAVKFIGDGSGLTNLPSSGDNLGNHTATTNLSMAGYMLTDISTITMQNGSIAIVAPGTGGSNDNYGISIGSKAYNNYTNGIGLGYQAYNNYSGIGVGALAYDNYSNGVGVGIWARTNYAAGVGVGYQAFNNHDHGVGVGDTATDNYNNGVGIGYNANSNYNNGVGMGNGAQNNYINGVGVGNYSANNHDYGTGVGAYTTAYSSSAAFGAYATAKNNEALALGAGATANAFRSVCIGAYCVNNATTTVKLKENYTLNVDSISISGSVARVTVSSNVFIIGYSSATKYYGDGSGLTGISGSGDNLGDHTATTQIKMGSYAIYSSSHITAAAYQINGSTVLRSLSGGQLVAVGYQAGNVLADGNAGTFLGYRAGGKTTAGPNVFIGDSAGYNNTSGAYNTLIGSEAGIQNATTNNNTLVGYRAGYIANTYDNTYVGAAVAYLASGHDNVALGAGAGYGNTNPSPGSYNVFVGADSGYNINTGINNSFLGYQSGNNNTFGNNNAFMGYQAGYHNLSGENNTAIGANTGWWQYYGSANTLLGSGAGYGAASYSSCTIVGYQAGYSLNGGSDNILMGWKAGYNITTGTGNIVIGYNNNTTAAAASNQLNIGGVIFGDLSRGARTQLPGAAVDIVSTGTSHMEMAQIWRASNGSVVSSMSATGVMKAIKFIGDGSGLTNLPSSGDNLGDHTATTALNMSQFPVVSVSSVAMVGDGLRIATSVYSGASGIFVSKKGEIWTLGAGNGTVLPNPRGSGAVDLQTFRSDGSQVASGAQATVSGGFGNTAGANYATVSGGAVNTAGANYATVSGGTSNAASGLSAVVSGGFQNTASNTKATVSGGSDNTASGAVATVSGGFGNIANGNHATVSGGAGNTAGGESSFVGGGGLDYFSGGAANLASGKWSVVVGGTNNQASDQGSVVVGGSGNRSSTAVGFNFIGGGENNVIIGSSGDHSVIGGGSDNAESNAVYSTISGGKANTVAIGADYATISGGQNNTALGKYSWVGGYYSSSTANGSFTWSDSEGVEVRNSYTDRTVFKNRGGFMVTGLTGALAANQGMLDVVSTGTASNVYAQIWRNGSGVVVASMTSQGALYATLPAGSGDNLGDHTATTNIQLGSNWLSNDGGNEGITVDNSGNAGIGTISPESRLDVKAAGSAGTDSAQIWRNSGNVVVASMSATGKMQAAYLNVGAGSSLADISLNSSGDAWNYMLTAGVEKFAFGYRNSTDKFVIAGNSAGWSDRVSIDRTSGNVGIGTVSPGHKLSVNDTDPDNYILAGFTGGKVLGSYRYSTLFFGQSEAVGESAGIGYLTHQTDNSLSGLYLANYGDDELTGGIFVKRGGNVGIGTASPQTGARLHVKSGASSASMPSNNQAVFEQAAGINGGIGIAYNNSSAGFYGHNAASAYDWGLEDIGGTRKVGLRAGGSDRIIIDTSGNVGISTDTPQARLDVKAAGSAATDMAQIWRNSAGAIVSSVSATGVIMAARFVGDGSGLTGVSGSDNLGNHTATQNIKLNGYWLSNDGGNEGAYVDTAGNVGIGTGTPGALLDVTANTSGDVRVSIFNAGSGGGSFIGRGARGTRSAPTALLQDDTLAGVYGAGYGATVFSVNQAALQMKAAQNWTDSAQGTYIKLDTTPLGATGRLERMRIDAGGNVGIGTATPAVQGDSARRYLTISGDTGAGMAEFITQQADADGVRVGGLQFTDKNSSAGDKRVAFLGAVLEGTTANNRGGRIDFHTKADGGALTERMRIDSNGQVTIGKYVTQANNSGVTLTAADFGKTITVNSASAQTVTLPSVTAADIGAVFTVVKLGSGKVTIQAAASTYIADSTSGGTIYNNAVSPAYATITIRLVTATQWVLIGGHGAWIST